MIITHPPPNGASSTRRCHTPLALACARNRDAWYGWTDGKQPLELCQPVGPSRRGDQAVSTRQCITGAMVSNPHAYEAIIQLSPSGHGSVPQRRRMLLAQWDAHCESGIVLASHTESAASGTGPALALRGVGSLGTYRKPESGICIGLCNNVGCHLATLITLSPVAVVCLQRKDSAARGSVEATCYPPSPRWRTNWPLYSRRSFCLPAHLAGKA